MKLLDTTFLIDLQRERRRKKEGPAHNFLLVNSDQPFAISIICVVEYEEGFQDSDLDFARQFLSMFPILDVNLVVARIGARVRRHLRTTGQMVGDHDVLIASTALAHDLTLVTDNTSHFSRIEGLKLEGY